MACIHSALAASPLSPADLSQALGLSRALLQAIHMAGSEGESEQGRWLAAWYGSTGPLLQQVVAMQQKDLSSLPDRGLMLLEELGLLLSLQGQVAREAQAMPCVSAAGRAVVGPLSEVAEFLSGQAKGLQLRAEAAEARAQQQQARAEAAEAQAQQQQRRAEAAESSRHEVTREVQVPLWDPGTGLRSF